MGFRCSLRSHRGRRCNFDHDRTSLGRILLGDDHRSRERCLPDCGLLEQQADFVAENKTLWDLTLDAEASRGTGGGGEATDYAAGLRLTRSLWDRLPELGLMSAKAGVQRAERGLAASTPSSPCRGNSVDAAYDPEQGLHRSVSIMRFGTEAAAGRR